MMRRDRDPPRTSRSVWQQRRQPGSSIRSQRCGARGRGTHQVQASAFALQLGGAALVSEVPDGRAWKGVEGQWKGCWKAVEGQWKGCWKGVEGQWTGCWKAVEGQREA